VALAAALGAEYCEICSDVDGVYTADPRVVPDARRIDTVGYDEMQELAEHGAKVLHAQAVEWARRAGIAIWARATASTPGEGLGTRIDAGGGARDGAVAVTGSRRLVRVRLARREGGAELLALLAAEAVALRGVSLGAQAEVCFAPDDVPDLPRVERALRERLPGCTVDEIGAVTAVGAGIGASATLLGRALAAAAEEGIEVERFEAAPMRLSLFVAPSAVDALTRALHRSLIG
jgi:aspartate kinase